MKIAIFPGSFDPFTKGHADIVVRGLALFDKIVVGIGINNEKHSLFSAQERKQTIERLFADNNRVEVKTYDCLTADFARQEGAQFILRGVRSMVDFEYERQMAQANKELGALETVLLFTRPDLAHISSSLVRDLYSHHIDISSYLPETTTL